MSLSISSLLTSPQTRPIAESSWVKVERYLTPQQTMSDLGGTGEPWDVLAALACQEHPSVLKDDNRLFCQNLPSLPATGGRSNLVAAYGHYPRKGDDNEQGEQ